MGYQPLTGGQKDHLALVAQQERVDSGMFQRATDEGVVRDMMRDIRARYGADSTIVAPEPSLVAAIPEPTLLFEVTSGGRSFEEIIASIEAKGRKLNDWSRAVVANCGEQPTTGTVYRFGGIPGDFFPTDAKRTTQAIRKEAKRRGYPEPTVESGLLLREKYSQGEVLESIHRLQADALYAPVLHPAVPGLSRIPCVLVLDSYGGAEWLYAWSANSEDQWLRQNVFLFLLPQVPSVSALGS